MQISCFRVAVTQEREQVELLGPQMVYYQPKVVENQGETKNDMEILLELAKRLGFTLAIQRIVLMKNIWKIG